MTKINLFIMMLVVLVSCKKSEVVSENKNKSAEVLTDSTPYEIYDTTKLGGEYAFIESIEVITNLGDSAYYDEKLPSGLSNKDFEVDFNTKGLVDLEWDLNIVAGKLFRGNSGSNRVNTYKAYLTSGEFVSYKDAYNFTGKVLVDIHDRYPNAKFYYVDLNYNNKVSPRLIATVTIKY